LLTLFFSLGEESEEEGGRKNFMDLFETGDLSDIEVMLPWILFSF
jgi:hypothetical protein